MIRLENVSKYYHSKTGVALGLRKIDLEFRKKEFVAITGESGSGKSTLLNVISGSDSYEEGEMYINGEATSHYTPEEWEEYRKNNISFIYQGYNLIDSYTVFENVQAALLIRGDTAYMEDKVYEYLEKVGLAELADNKAVHLSSGQKQRLAIARALAKETEIICADEPTGNLDRENGMQVMEILAELSKEKMVIVVTHNYDQAEPYATRKIRMYNGEVAEDMDLFHNEDGSIREYAHTPLGEDIDEREVEERKLGYVGYTQWDFIKEKLGIAWTFVSLNRRNQPKRNLFTFAFYMFVTLAFFIFMGSLFNNMSTLTAGYYSDKAFKNGNDKRIIVRHFDDSVITQEDIDRISKVSKVQIVDRYDTVNDINYVCEKDVDYKVIFDVCEREYYDDPDNTFIEFLDESKFMMSSTVLKESDLAVGSLPTKMNEIVVFSRNTNLVGEKVTYYLKNRKTWPAQYVEYEFTITGVLNSYTEQTYFSEELCRYLSADFTGINSKWYVMYGSNGRGISFSTKVTNGAIASNLALGYPNTILKVNNSLAYGEIVASQRLFDRAVQYTGGKRYQKKVGAGTMFTYLDKDGKQVDVELSMIRDESGSSENVIEVSYELFETIFTDLSSRQASVYISDYAYTDEVLKDLNELGYDAVSVHRVGATAFDQETVMSKLKSMGISAAALLVIFFLGWMLTYTLLKLKKGDFIIFKSIGMEQQTVNNIIMLDVATSFAGATILSIFLAYVISWCDVEYVYNLLKYYNLLYYGIFIVIIAIMAVLIIRSYSKYIKKRNSIIDLKMDN
ncbi:MAG: ABC transporter ATP-binding protein [Lachnospiraceae bacterium]|nr:ABC transporter ATP-binding protein [Lachnospiraceae bacterium]